jgi:hypothetical protein
MAASRTSTTIDAWRNDTLNAPIAISSRLRYVREVYAVNGLHPFALFPFQFGIRRCHVAAVEQVEGRPLVRFRQPDFVGCLLDGLAIADCGSAFRSV